MHLAAEMLKPYVREDIYHAVYWHQEFQGRYYFEHLGKDPEGRERFRGESWYGLAEKLVDDWDAPAFDPGFVGLLKTHVGLLAGVDRELTVQELVTLFGGYYPHPRDAAEVIDLVGLGDKRTARTRTLSGGQQRRLDLALGIVGDPDLLFLDEPTTGFDPSARHRSWELVESLRDLGKTILLTTHYMDEAQNLADRVAIMAAGRIVAQGSPESLGGRDVAEAEVSFRLPPGVGLADLPGELRDGLRRHEDRVLLRTSSPTRDLHVLTGWAVARGEELEALAVTRPSLEDVYLQLTGASHG